MQRVTTTLFGVCFKPNSRQILRSVIYRNFSANKLSQTHTILPESVISGVANNLTMGPITGVKCDWDLRKYTVESIKEKTDDLISRIKVKYDSIGSLEDHQINYKSLIKVLADIDNVFNTDGAPLEFIKHASTDKELRDASTEASKKLDDFNVEMSMRKDIFDNVAYYYEHQPDNLTAETKRYIERIYKLGKRNGLHLDEATRDEIKKIKKRSCELNIDYQKAVGEDKTTIEFSDEQLAGLPDDFINCLHKTELGTRTVTLQYPHFFPIVRKCRNPDTRFDIQKAFHSRCLEENTPIIEELITLRQKQATLLGYATHADFVTEMRMAKDAATVKKFLADLALKLKPLWVEEQKTMLKLKKEECAKYNFEFDGKINYWDVMYYMSRVEEEMFAVDQNQLKEYFPLPVVTKGLLQIYQDLLGLKFTEIPDADVWHPDVSMYRVEDSETGELLGFFFLDLFPREGKYNHAAIFPLQPSCVGPDGKRQVSVVAMEANFTKPTQDKPSLLDHNDVETFFHEFGHVMHYMCAKTDFVLFSGTRVERDFVEAPSQMLENWVWQAEPLRKMSGHYVTGEPMPNELIENLIKSKKANSGIFNLRQIVFATFDQTVHTTNKADTQQLFDKLFQEIIGISCIPDTNTAASFSHIVNGYDAQYYGYLWSEVFSADMFASRFKMEGALNPKTGKDYRHCILKPGGSIDATEMLKNFLGREPNEKAFLESKGLTPS